MSGGKGSNIKGGGRAILSQESQTALIDLLMSLEDDDDGGGRGGDDGQQPSEHDKKRQRKKFVKRLIDRHEMTQIREKYGASSPAARPSNSVDSNNKGGESAPSPRNAVAAPRPLFPSSNSSVSPNVRVELAEAIFSTSIGDKKKEKKKKSGHKDKKKSKKKTTFEFKVGAKKVTVLSRTTTITEILKKSKAKLNLKKNPVRAFVQAGDVNWDLDGDLTAVEDGTVLYISVTLPPAAAVTEKAADGGGKISGDEDGDASNSHEIVDPLESVKLAYRKQEAYQQPRQLEKADEIVDEAKRSSLEKTRSKLPVYSHKEKILDAIDRNAVVILSGATGSGKSTQVPQFLLDESNQQKQPKQRPDQVAAGMKRPYIVVTQPRKVAAISLAQRVAEERGSPPPGAAGSSVGYMVRSDRRVDLRSCRIVYMTIGILLRMLVNRKSRGDRACEVDGDDEDAGDKTNVVPPLSVDTISHLIIDETHERDVNTDFSLTLLKGMVASSSLPASNSCMPKLVLMSATASSELFVSYFSTNSVLPASIEVPGKTFPVETRWLAECEKFARQTMMSNRGGRVDQRSEHADNDKDASSNAESNSIELSPRATDKIDNRFIRSLVVTIIKEQQSQGVLVSTDEPYRSTGAVLVFLPGMGEIESLSRCLAEAGTVVSNHSLCRVMKLHSTIPKAEQRRVFEPAEAGTVKVVLATNIAETSVTIPDISHVIDACRVKESRYNPSTRIKELVTVWASHASMKQRAGRAGRTSRGICWRLCSEEFSESSLLPYTVPEMARTPLDELILQIGLLFEQRRDEYYRGNTENEDGDKRRPFAPGFNPIKFLSMTPTPPGERGLMQSCKHLLEVEALKVVDYGNDVDGQARWLYRLTPLGYHLSRLPMDAKVGKMLIIGCLLGCLDNALTIAAALSCTKSCFLPNRQLDPACVDARDSLVENGFGGRYWPGGTVKGDSMAVIAAYRAWTNEEKSNRWKFCRSCALDIISLSEMETLRMQFFDLMVDAGLVSSTKRARGSSTHEADDSNIARDDALLTSCCIVGGLYPNVCTLVRPTGPRGGGRLLTNDSDMLCRPSSNSFQKTRVHNASKSGKDAYAVYHTKHRSIGTVISGQKRSPETFLSEVTFVSKFALLLFGGELKLVKNAIIVDKWLKFKVSMDDNSVKENAILILSLRELMDKVVLEHVVGTFSLPEEKALMVERHKRIIEIVRMVLADEG